MVITNVLFGIIHDGGYAFMIPLITLSVLALAVILERVVYYAHHTVLPQPIVAKVKHHVVLHEMKAAADLLHGSKTLCAETITKALHNIPDSAQTAELEKALQNSADISCELLNGRLWMLRAIGHIAPLLGLLGTVVGLSISFHQIAQQGLSQQSVAGGISMALITTVAGLTIALPSLLSEYCLRAWAQAQFREMKQLFNDFISWYEQSGK